MPDCPTYNEFIYSFGTVRSVTTICFTNACVTHSQPASPRAASWLLPQSICHDVAHAHMCMCANMLIREGAFVRTAAQDMQVYTLIRQAGGIFFTGGDQWLYVSWWNNTLVSQGTRSTDQSTTHTRAHQSNA